MEQVDSMLRELADNVADYEREAGAVLLRRQGREYSLALREKPGAGVMVSGDVDGQALPEAPFSLFVQTTLLDLPRFATQITRTLDRSSSSRPGKYINGPAELSADSQLTRWTETSEQFRRFLNEQEAGTTRLVQLTAGAGQGKTVLLEEVARASASAYHPDIFPTPFLLTVDLLGRYVGTVDDAIAGSLNNTYNFPALNQRDIALCVRNRWLQLALDGFDELVARVGPRDAFLRVTELLEQLRGSGTVILSARESFFELYQIGAAIRSYLRPRQGSYSTSTVRLLPWSEDEGRRVFAAMGSRQPKEDLAGLLSAFGDDKRVVLQPFFLTRLASLWSKGERFADAGGTVDPYRQTAYIIETYIERETKEKWIDREGRQLLDRNGHTALLAGLAEQMWSSGAFKLSAEEIRLAAEYSMVTGGYPPLTVDEVKVRAPTHAALMTRDGGYSFIHDRFFHYYLAVRLCDALRDGSGEAQRTLLSAKEFSPEIIDWVAWLLNDDAAALADVRRHSLELAAVSTTAKVHEANMALLLGVLLAGAGSVHDVRKLTFLGESLHARRYSGLRFVECEFYQLDLSGTVFASCEFERCIFGDVLVSASTRFERSTLRDCQWLSIEGESGVPAFEPNEVRDSVRALGAQWENSADRAAEAAFASRVDRNASGAVALAVKWSQRSCDIALQDLEAKFPDARAILKLGLEAGVLKEHLKATSGRHKDFFRFQGDRQLLLRGQAERTGDARVDAFWDAMGKRFPRK